jgi:predicted TIM-barrel fold metal-dependent hydrolase
MSGSFKHDPEDLAAGLSPAARTLVRQAFADLDAAALVDYHAHVIGVGTGKTGASLNATTCSWRHPLNRFQANVYANAAGIKQTNRFDQEYVERLVRLARNFSHPIRIHLLALDRAYNPDGTVNEDQTVFHVPNDYVMRLARTYPDVFVPVISVHPYRRDALAELKRWAAQGARYVKWLPNSQGMDPANACCDSFYRTLAQHHMVLLSHTGDEHALGSNFVQALGNPLRLRRALDLGVTVIAAHTACSGHGQDLDHPGTEAANSDLLLRMMADKRYRGRLFADISAMTQFNHLPGAVSDLLRRPELHDRLVNGSDYPLPAVNFMIWTGKLANLGLITKKQQPALAEIYDYNPLLFDYVLKRTIRDPRTGRHFPPGVFLANPGLTAATQP